MTNLEEAYKKKCEGLLLILRIVSLTTDVKLKVKWKTTLILCFDPMENHLFDPERRGKKKPLPGNISRRHWGV
jgi:hypothetical protein